MSGGTERRTQILPTKTPEDTGYILPDYDFAANMPMPDSIGVRRGDNLSDVMSAAKGVMYYTDMIGFGGPSSSLTQGMPFRKLGINFFTKTGMTCSNGADMWTYFEGIPKGDALGKTLQTAMSRMGYPQLQGLAPGILEDTKAALNPRPIVQAAFGNPYPVCELVTKPVGDDQGNISDPNDGTQWIVGDVTRQNGVPMQTRWVQKVDKKGNPLFISKEEYDSTPKLYNADGSKKKVAGFEDARKTSLVVAIVLVCGAFALTYGRKK